MQNVINRNRFQLYVSDDSKLEETMKYLLNYFFIHLTDIILRNEYRELQLFFILENGDVRL